jgi:uncharacterized integral membrane protein
MVIFLVAIFFSIQNRDPVTLRFGLYPFQSEPWFEVPEVPLFLVILCGIFLGLLIGGIGDLYKRFQLKRAIRQNQKVIERLEKEVDSLRNSPLDRPSSAKDEP